MLIDVARLRDIRQSRPVCSMTHSTVQTTTAPNERAISEQFRRKLKNDCVTITNT